MKKTFLTTLVILAIPAVSAFAADWVWNESSPDGGNTFATAYQPPQSGAVVGISGTLTSGDVDIYKIVIDGTGDFSALPATYLELFTIANTAQPIALESWASQPYGEYYLKVSGYTGAEPHFYSLTITGDSVPTPDGGMTVALFGMALGCLRFFRRK